MKRILEQKILSWANSPQRKPLIVRGARQVGKTWLIENALGKKFNKIIKIDLEKQPQFHKAFEGDLSPNVMLNTIELLAEKISPGNTLLFIDEIQTCPRAITALRYFYEEMPQLHVVAAGSMLEFALGQMSVPVGRIEYLYLSPMTFYEFLLAIGKDVMAETLLEDPSNHSEATVNAIHQQLRIFFFVGGMPEAVLAYRNKLSYMDAFNVHQQILTSYRDDFAKYNPSVNYSCLDGVFISAARFVGEQIKYTRLYEHASGVTNHKALDLLCKAKLIYQINSTDPSGLPLGSSDGKRFKVSILDIGLLQHLCGINPTIATSSENLLSLYRGKLAEQFVAQELLAWHSQKLYYWSRRAKSSNAEVDYLTLKDGNIYPVEVKAAPAGRLRSLHSCLATYPNCKQGWVLQENVYRELPKQNLIFWPLYATPHLGNRENL